MKLAFVVNDIDGEQTNYTTTELAMVAIKLGHEVYYIGIADFTCKPDGLSFASARQVRRRRYSSPDSFLNELRKTDATRVELEALDVLLLRNDPAQNVSDPPWARLAGITFGRLAARHGVIVLNDPDGMMHATDKTYLEYFPEEVRPRTLISRDREALVAFIKEQKGHAVLKPLAGSGGHNVFLITPEEANVNQIIDAVCEEGYAIAQERLPGAEQGDTRMLLMNGRPLQCEGRYAAIHRARGEKAKDIRSNISAGASTFKAQVTESMLRLADIIRPQLIRDGMFLVGIDIIDDKVVEINVFSPGGVNFARELEGVDFAHEILRALEQKVSYKRGYRSRLENAQIATL